MQCKDRPTPRTEVGGGLWVKRQRPNATKDKMQPPDWSDMSVNISYEVHRIAITNACILATVEVGVVNRVESILVEFHRGRRA
jgi:hypothetical protein